jgi:hypothetical protein
VNRFALGALVADEAYSDGMWTYCW